MLSMATGSEHIDHVKTQIPYAITGAVFAMIAYIIVGVLNSILGTGVLSTVIGTIVALIVGVAGIILFVKKVGKKTDIKSLQEAK